MDWLTPSSPRAWPGAGLPSGAAIEEQALARIKSRPTGWLDWGLMDWLESRAPEGGYQTEINRVLRRYVMGAGR